MSTKAGLAKFNIKTVTDKWLELQKVGNVFSYSLNIRKERYLNGNLHFYAEYNPERISLRRAPQTITSLNPQYDNEQFNFNKIDPRENIVSIPYNGIEVAFIINKSPLNMYHTLICPDLKGCHAQRVTLDSLSFSVALLMQLDEKAFRIGYNSPGALASVNHLHFHLLHIDVDLYVDHAKLELLNNKHIYRLSKEMPTQAICWLIYKTDSELERNVKSKEIYDFIIWLCEHNHPHNLFLTPARNSHNDAIKIFVFVREKYCNVKDLQNLNIGFCELSGFVPVGNSDIFDSLTEKFVTTKICEEIGCVFDEVYKYFERKKTK